MANMVMTVNRPHSVSVAGVGSEMFGEIHIPLEVAGAGGGVIAVTGEGEITLPLIRAGAGLVEVVGVAADADFKHIDAAGAGVLAVLGEPARGSGTWAGGGQGTISLLGSGEAEPIPGDPDEAGEVMSMELSGGGGPNVGALQRRWVRVESREVRL